MIRRETVGVLAFTKGYPRDVAKFFESRYRTELDNSESQINLDPFVPALNNTTKTFLVKDAGNALLYD